MVSVSDSVHATQFQEMKPGVKVPARQTFISPRFYTTDFKKFEEMDFSANHEQIESVVAELRADYNKKNFVRSEEFDRSWDHIQGETRTVFIEFLERACTNEFSGFLLYKELSRQVQKKHPVLAEGFRLMSRDEARHAGFLNKSMSDFNLQLDLGFLTKHKDYTFFPPSWVFYATYLSERIGYWRFITIFREVDSRKNESIYPLFNLFEAWCQDENRHGDFFAAVIKSQPELTQGLKARLMCKCFLMLVCTTMYLNDAAQWKFYDALEINTKEFGVDIIKKTNDSARKVFPVVLDVENPKFFARLDACAAHSEKISAITRSGGIRFLSALKKLPHVISIAIMLLKIVFEKGIDTSEHRGKVF